MGKKESIIYLMAFLALFLIAWGNSQGKRVEAQLSPPTDWKHPVSIAIAEGRSEWDGLNQAGWPEDKITVSIVEQVQESPLNKNIYAKRGGVLRAGDKLQIPAYKPASEEKKN